MAVTWVRAESSLVAVSSASAPRASMINVQLCRASSRASARPSPREAPVISAVGEELVIVYLPLRGNWCSLCCHHYDACSGVRPRTVGRYAACTFGRCHTPSRDTVGEWLFAPVATGGESRRQTTTLRCDAVKATAAIATVATAMTKARCRLSAVIHALIPERS